jgi:hypothetical protein
VEYGSCNKGGENIALRKGIRSVLWNNLSLLGGAFPVLANCGSVMIGLDYCYDKKSSRLQSDLTD